MSDGADASEAAIVASFLNQLLMDRHSGVQRGLTDYQRRFPGYEHVIAAEFAQLEGGDAPEGDPPPDEAAMIRGAVADRYRDEHEIARGGMGTIYRVFDPTLRRELAKKVLGSRDGGRGSGTAMVARFLEEAHVTAQLEHPGIVPVHELGIDHKGRVYFTMSLVHGRNFKEVIDLVHAGRDGWTRTRALGVLQRVCEAVAFAHSKGVIHRDLKPANVMVGQFGETYVMDWGLVRVVGVDEADRGNGTAAPAHDAGAPGLLARTLDGDVVGTPAYMAPEQARGEITAIGPRTDVFAIGAMLYHLLAGRMPYADVGSSTWQEFLDATLSGPPTSLREAGDRVPEELVAICERAMARDPADRYPSVLELGDDIRAFLEDRVVRAHRTGALAELTKWVKRNRLAAAAAALALLSLAAGLGTSLWLNAETKRAKVAAELELGVRQAVLDFLNKDLLAAVAPGAVGKDASMREVLDMASRNIEGRFPDQPIVEAAVRTTLGDTYRRLGALDEAERHLLRAVELQAAHADPIASESVRTRRVLAIVYREQGRVRDAVEMGREILAISRAAFGPEHDDTLTAANNLGLALCNLGQNEEAERLLRDVYDVRRDKLGVDHDHTLVSMCNLGLLYYNQGRYREAEPLIKGELDLCTDKHGEENPGTLVSMNNYANLLSAQGRYEEALREQDRIVRISTKVRGATHLDTVNSMVNRANILRHLGRFADADEAVVLARSNAAELAADHPTMLVADLLTADLQIARGDAESALPALDDLVARYRRVIGDRAVKTLEVRGIRAKALVAMDRPADALRELDDAIAAAGGDETGRLSLLRVQRGELLTGDGRFAEAEADLLRAEGFFAASAPADPSRGDVLRAIVRLYETWPRPEEAERWRARIE